MNLFCEEIRELFGNADKKRDENIKELKGIATCCNIPYCDGDEYNLLDIYYPDHTNKNLPTIINIHGGAYVYGTKEVYKHYGMFMAEQGFTFVNLNYHLAPENKFPTQLSEISKVFDWMVNNAKQYHIDLENVFMVGDSAGAQMLSHFCTIYSKSHFEELFPFVISKQVKIRAIALNCGMYDISSDRLQDSNEFMDMNELLDCYIGKNRNEIDSLLRVKENITSTFPPTYIMTAQYDFLKNHAEPMYIYLRSKGIESKYRLYNKEGKESIGHVFHCNMNLDEAKDCNRDECDFFRKYIVT